MSKIYFQGTFGAYSHLAALSIDPKAEILPCKTFDDCFNKASEEPDSRIIIPESNRITGNIGIEYLIFRHRLNIYKEHFQKIEHNLLGQSGAKLKDIKEVYSHAQGLSQCSNFIKKNNLFEHIRADTAGSAEAVSKKKIKSQAAIASSLSAKIYKLKIVEDAAEGLGTFYKKRHVGTIGDIGVFSFSTPKIISTGQGGMIITNNKKLYERCMELKDFGRSMGVKKKMMSSFEHKTIGYNFKFTEFQAAVGISQMKKLSKRIKIKKNMFSLYHELLNKISGIEFIETDLDKITPWMIDIVLKNKKKKIGLINFLEKNMIETRIFYPPIHKLTPYREKNKKYPITTDISDRGLWLPSSVNLKHEEIDFISKKIREFFK